MSLLDRQQQTGIDYAPCRYGTSRTLFRGPARSLDGDYVAVLGGTETYGRFVAEPFPDLVEQRLERPTVNFGCVNAGLDVFIHDRVVIRACRSAALTVVQVVGAVNMSNRFYTVHQRRNDRFLRASRRMTAIWPDVDFSEIHFTRHLLNVLGSSSPRQCASFRAELAGAWTARMQSLVRELSGRVVLLWIADRSPEEAAGDESSNAPLFVTREMIEVLRRDVLDIVEVVAPERYGDAETEGMIFPELERSVAQRLPGPRTHALAADALAPSLERLL